MKNPFPINDNEGQTRLPSGYTLYWKRNDVGGRTYWSDEVGGGVEVWDTAIVDDSTLLAAIVAERSLLTYENNKRNVAKR